MNVVINKLATELNIPCDIENVITSYCYFANGYTVDQMKEIETEKQKPRNKFSRLRLKLELSEWYKYNVSVCWLRPTGRGVYGKKNPYSVYGGGTLYESRLLKEYHLVANYINEKLTQGEERRGRKNELTVS
jgi:hypothetical protein